MQSRSGFRPFRSSTTGRPVKKPGEFPVQASSRSSHSAKGASGASVKATKERAWKRMDFFEAETTLSNENKPLVLMFGPRDARLRQSLNPLAGPGLTLS